MIPGCTCDAGTALMGLSYLSSAYTQDWLATRAAADSRTGAAEPSRATP